MLLLYSIALLSPILLLFLGTTTKKIVRGPGWRRQDLYLGVELALAAFSSGLTQLYDLAKQAIITQAQTGQAAEQISLPAYNVIYLFGFLLLSFSAFVYSMSAQQDIEAKDALRAQPIHGVPPHIESLKQAFSDMPKSAIALNIVGLVLMVLFVLFIKGV